MIFTYDELNKQKESGIELSWTDISEEQLRKLYAGEKIPTVLISRLYNVKKSQIDYKRKKFGINFMETITNNFVDNVSKNTNETMKKVFLDNFDIDKLSKIITNYAFRNGPVEDIHASGKLSEEDMMILNKYMVNRIAGILQLIKNEQWFKLVCFLETYKLYGDCGANWDKAEPDIEEIDKCLKLMRQSI
jgi:hypothetical protein